MEIAKALVLAGPSAGDRPWPSVGSGPKELVPLANRPILFHNLEALRSAGVLEATIAVGAYSADAIVAAVGTGASWDLTVRYVEWDAQTGITGALALARGSIADEPVLVQPADALHRDVIHPHIAAFARQRLDAMALTIDCGSLLAPAVGGYLLSGRAVSILTGARAEPSDPLAEVRRNGGSVCRQPVDTFLACHGGQDGLLEGNRRMLESLRAEASTAAFPTCEFQGPVVVDPSASLDHALVRGPAIIGARTSVSHAYIGPYTSIGGDVRIDGAQVEHSIVLDGAQLLNVGTRLDSSVIGRGARISRMFGHTTAMRLSVGDGATVTLS